MSAIRKHGEPAAGSTRRPEGEGPRLMRNRLAGHLVGLIDALEILESRVQGHRDPVLADLLPEVERASDALNEALVRLLNTIDA